MFAHRQLETEQATNGPIGVHVADYVIRFEDANTVTVPIRERYEISAVGDRQGISRYGVGYPYLAVTDQGDTLAFPATKGVSTRREDVRLKSCRHNPSGTGCGRGAIRRLTVSDRVNRVRASRPTLHRGRVDSWTRQ